MKVGASTERDDVYATVWVDVGLGGEGGTSWVMRGRGGRAGAPAGRGDV